MRPIIQLTHRQEQRARRDAVIEHLQNGALDALTVEREDAERHKAHVRNRRVGHQLLEIRLSQRQASAIQNGPHREPENHRSEGRRRFRKNGKTEPQEPIAAHLQQDAGQDDATGRWGFRVGIREPRMERDHGQLDGKSKEERKEIQNWTSEGYVLSASANRSKVRPPSR